MDWYFVNIFTICAKYFFKQCAKLNEMVKIATVGNTTENFIYFTKI